MSDEPSNLSLIAAFRRKEWLTRKECSEFLNALGIKISKNHLSNLAANNNEKKGPPFHRTRWTRVAYKASDVEDWAKAQTVRIA